MPIRCVCSTLLIAVLAANAYADFVPGRIYVTKGNPECGLGGVFGRIYEFDPVTSNWSLFADLPGFCSLAGMTFTPEGKLRVAGFKTSTVIEFESDGTWKVVLDSSHGIHLPGANNCITYDQAGNFFVSQGITADSNIMKFPGGQAPGSVFASLATGMTGTAPIAAAPDGSIYYRPTEYPGPAPHAAILKYAPDGTPSLFDVVGSVYVKSLLTSSDGTLYAPATGGLYRYLGGNASTKQLISTQFFDSEHGITLSADEKTLYTILGGMVAVDLETGASQVLAPLPHQPLLGGWGSGIAVYVPEPSCIFLLLLVVTGGGCLRLRHSKPEGEA